MKKFMSIPSMLLAYWLLSNLQEPHGIYEVIWVLVIAVVLGSIAGFFAYLFFMAYIKKTQDR